MKNQLSIVKSNVVGAIAGSIVVFLVAKKYGHVSSKTALIVLAVVGVAIGANAQSMIKAKQGAKKTASVVK